MHSGEGRACAPIVRDADAGSQAGEETSPAQQAAAMGGNGSLATSIYK